MASSLSVSTGQIALVCQSCKKEPKIKWKCVECKLMMCHRCREKEHPKVPSAGDHTIKHIKDSRTQDEESEPDLDFSAVKCPVHKGQNCCLFCKTCMDVICPTCYTKTHNSHDLVEMWEGYEIQKEKAKNFKKNMETKIPDLSRKEEYLSKIKISEQSKYNEIRQDIFNQEEAMTRATKQYKDKLLDELDQNWNKLQKSVDKEGEKVKKKQKKFFKRREKVKDLLISKDANKVFSSSRDLFSSTDEKIEVKTSFYQIPNFIGGDLEGISSLFGSLNKVTTRQELVPVIRILHHYQTNLYSVSNISVCPDDTLWIGNGGSMLHVKSEHKSMKILSEIAADHGDSALLLSGDLLITSLDSHLKLVPKGTSHTKQTHNITPGMKTIAVHVTSNNNIIVTASNDRTLFSNERSRQLIVMDQDGKTLKIHEYDRNRKPLFTYPFRVCSNSLNNIAVVDRNSDEKGRVVVLDQEGEVHNIYTGHPDVNNEDNIFNPRDIVTTHSDNFVISDPLNYTLHILREKGQIFTYCNMKKLISGEPLSLTIHGINNLYIGTYPDEGMAKIYKTDISGW